MPVKAIAPHAAGEPGRDVFGWRHPLARVAARRCGRAHEVRPVLVGRVACQGCWDFVVLADREFALAYGLPLEIEEDPSYVDEVAVRMAVEGKKVELTRLERRVVRSRLARERAKRNLLRSFRCAQHGGAR